MAHTSKFLRNPKVEAHRFCMTDVHVAIWFGGEACNYATTVASVFGILRHNLADKIRAGLRASHFSTHFDGIIA